MIEVKVINSSTNPLPDYKTLGSAGIDLQAWLAVPLTLMPLERYLVPTGLQMEIPEGYEAQVRPRSGLALNHGVSILNSPGTIDSDYRGEVKVLLVNLSSKDYTIHPGDRIAQLVFSKYEKAILKVDVVLTESHRGNGGFGHTGK